jgi:small subunit ribosomal protein S9
MEEEIKTDEQEEKQEWEKLENVEENLRVLEEDEKAGEKEEEKKQEEFVSAPQLEDGKYVEGIGRRKEAVARVRIWNNPEGTSMQIFVNDRHYTEYFPALYLQKSADAPLRKLKLFNQYKVTVKVKGGGLHGQADAIKLGLARALVKLNPEWRSRLKKAGLLTRDPREVERKKYGLKKARRAPQWHKR